MGKEVPQRHSWDSRDTVQWPVNWPKELKEDPFKARKEVIHQEINRKVKNWGDQGRRSWRRQFPCIYSCLPWQERLTMNPVSRSPFQVVTQWSLRTVILAHQGSQDQP